VFLKEATNQVKIPKVFLEHPKIKYLFHGLIDQFNFEEKRAIYFYYFSDKGIDEIIAVTDMTFTHVESVLQLYTERLEAKVKFFKKILPYNSNDQFSVSELLFSEYEMEEAMCKSVYLWD